jgi:hypothetical protein
MHYMESEGRGGAAPAARHPGGRGIGSVPQGRAAVGPSRRLRCGAGHAADVADDPELVDDAACDQLVEQLLRMLGVPFDAARELAHAPLPVAVLPEPR